ncbi:MAG: hypothetical protein IJC43_02015, partial [Clostridia bacterium]|nr:hypothetical protein [Clostridia bacterium]
SRSRAAFRGITDTRDVSRTTFDAHFETRDFLLKALCRKTTATPPLSTKEWSGALAGAPLHFYLMI